MNYLRTTILLFLAHQIEISNELPTIHPRTVRNCSNLDPSVPFQGYPPHCTNDTLTPKYRETEIEIYPESNRNAFIEDVWERNDYGFVEIPYEFGNSATDSIKKAVADAVKAYQVHTCVRPRLRKPKENNYIEIINGNGCYLRGGVGNVPGKRELSLEDPACAQPFVAIHELMHAVGFKHEHNRPDRNEYIRVNFDNIDSYNSYIFGEEDFRDVKYNILGPYDYDSVMHYEAYALSVNGNAVMERTRGVEAVKYKLGNRYGLTLMDIHKINKHLGCTSFDCTKHPECCDAYGYFDINGICEDECHQKPECCRNGKYDCTMSPGCCITEQQTCKHRPECCDNSRTFRYCNAAEGCCDGGVDLCTNIWPSCCTDGGFKWGRSCDGFCGFFCKP